MVNIDPEALRAAAESARQKSQLGSSATDQLAPGGSIVVSPEPLQSQRSARSQRPGQPGTTDLRTRYMGLWLENPVVASAGPLSQSVAGIEELAAGGVGAIVMYSLFEEQIRHEKMRAQELIDLHTESFAEALGYFPTEPSNESGLTRKYLDTLEKAAGRIRVPLIASLNGSAAGDWTGTARRLQDAGAAGIELNVYYVPGNIHDDAREAEQRHLEILAEVKQQVGVPVAMKLSPYFSSFGQLATRLDDAGVDALVLFNRYLQPDIDLDTLTVVPGFELSTPAEAKLPHRRDLARPAPRHAPRHPDRLPKPDGVAGPASARLRPHCRTAARQRLEEGRDRHPRISFERTYGRFKNKNVYGKSSRIN